MVKHLHIYFGMLLFLSACGGGTDLKNEQFAIDELIMLRTEGLILAETIAEQAQDEDVRQIGQKIIDYYKETHPHFIDICRGRAVSLQAHDFDALYQNVSVSISDSDNPEMTYIQLYKENIVKSIVLYEIILERNDWEDISVFSLIALPELYNQHLELETILDQPMDEEVEPKKSTSSSSGSHILSAAR